MKPEMVVIGPTLIDLTTVDGNLMLVAPTQELGGTMRTPHKVPGHQMKIMKHKDTLCLLQEIMMVKSITTTVSMWLIGI